MSRFQCVSSCRLFPPDHWVMAMSNKNACSLPLHLPRKRHCSLLRGKHVNTSIPSFCTTPLSVSQPATQMCKKPLCGSYKGCCSEWHMSVSVHLVIFPSPQKKHVHWASNPCEERTWGRESQSNHLIQQLVGWQKVMLISTWRTVLSIDVHSITSPNIENRCYAIIALDLFKHILWVLMHRGSEG